MINHKRLTSSKAKKNDEFYTQMVDIENELKHYKNHFKDKIVLCNCDDPYESNFFKYFALNFNTLKLKKLICTCYAGSPVIYEQLSILDIEPLKIYKGYENKPYKIEITEIPDVNNDGAVDLSDVECLLKSEKNVLTLLNGDGDFRSKECIELLKESDIVVTNPPFSLFREYVQQLMDYNKKFIIIGHQNAISYKEIFPLLKDNKMWIGYGMNLSMRFRMSDSYVVNGKTSFIDEKGHKIGTVSGITWYTNLEIEKRHEDIILYKKYSKDDYPKYENYDAINVDMVTDIPVDYMGKMGVPITFLGKYNPDQFEIIGLGVGALGQELEMEPIPKEIDKSLPGHSSVWRLYLMKDGKAVVPYARIIIIRKV